MELKNKYSNIQSKYSKMLKDVKKNNMSFKNISEDIIELNYIIELMTLKLEDISIKLIDPNTCSKLDKHIIEEFEENEQILKTMLPLFLSLKMTKRL